MNHYFRRSASLREADGVSELSEGLPVQHQAVFADDSDFAGGVAAFSAVLSIFTGVSSPEQVGHTCGY